MLKAARIFFIVPFIAMASWMALTERSSLIHWFWLAWISGMAIAKLGVFMIDWDLQKRERLGASPLEVERGRVQLYAWRFLWYPIWFGMFALGVRLGIA